MRRITTAASTSGGAYYNNITNNNAWNNSRGIDLAASWYNNLTSNTVWSNTQAGIYLDLSDHNTLTGNNASSNNYGIDLGNSDNNNLTGNNASNNTYGIYLNYSDYNNLTNNTAANNTFEGICLSYSDYNNLTGNTVWNNTDGIYLQGSGYNNLTSNYAGNNTYGFYLSSSNNNNLTGNYAWNNSRGIYLNSSDGNTIFGNGAWDNTYGFYLGNSYDNIISDSNAWDSPQSGFYLWSSDNNTIINSDAWNTTDGFYLYDSDYNTLTGGDEATESTQGIHLNNSDYNNISISIIYNNTDGFYLNNSDYNNITGNTIYNNTDHSIRLEGSSNTTIALNDFFNCTGSSDVYCSNTNYTTIYDNTFFGNGGPSYAVEMHNEFSGLIDDNEMRNYSTEAIFTDDTTGNISNNLMADSAWGIEPYDSTLFIFNNRIENGSADGIDVYSGANLTIYDNFITNFSNGIYCNNNDPATLFVTDNNTITNCTNGILIENCQRPNVVYNNTLTGNDYGIYLDPSTNSTIYNNYFYNTINAYDDGNNTWNITPTPGRNIIGGPNLGGNYWSDYAGRDLGGDGLGDTLLPYNCAGNISSGGDYHPLTIIDVVVIPTTGLVTTESGGNATFVVVLNCEPTAEVTVGLSSSDTTEGTVSPTVVTFTNLSWNIPQTVTVTGVDDTILDGDIAYQIITAPAVSDDADYAGKDALDVNVTNLDDELIKIAAGAAGGGAGGRAAEPAAFSASYLQISPQQASPNQPVTISINIANIGGESGSHTVTLYINGNAEQSQTVTISPGSTQSVVFTVTRATAGTYLVTVEGQSGQFVVVAGGAGGGILGGGGAGGAGGLGTAGLIAIIVVVIALIVGLIFVTRGREQI